MAYRLETLVYGSMDQNCYLLWDDLSRDAVVIDPGSDAPALCRAMDAAGLRPALILATHGHFDHVGAVHALAAAYGAPFAMAAADEGLLENLEDNYAFYGLGATQRPVVDRRLVPGETLKVGSLQLKVLGTPGHTPGGLCFYHDASSNLFSGDTLFAGSVGRSDFEGGDHAQLIDSIRRELLSLPADTAVRPGHGAASTLAQERAHNRFLQ